MKNSTVIDKFTGEKIRRIKPYGRTYYQRLRELVESNNNFHPCKTCGNPVQEPLICQFCGETEPN